MAILSALQLLREEARGAAVEEEVEVVAAEEAEAVAVVVEAEGVAAEETVQPLCNLAWVLQHL